MRDWNEDYSRQFGAKQIDVDLFGIFCTNCFCNRFKKSFLFYTGESINSINRCKIPKTINVIEKYHLQFQYWITETMICLKLPKNTHHFWIIRFSNDLDELYSYSGRLMVELLPLLLDPDAMQLLTWKAYI